MTGSLSRYTIKVPHDIFKYNGTGFIDLNPKITRSFIVISCYKRQITFLYTDTCLDTKSDCKKRAQDGECSKATMELECPHTCGYCDECTSKCRNKATVGFHCNEVTD